MVENEWRLNNCDADFPAIECDEMVGGNCECPDAWTCDDIAVVSDEVFYALDSN